MILCAAMCIAQTPSSASSAQDSQQAAAAAQPKIDPAKEADIRNLLDMIGTKANMVQVMTAMEANMRPSLTNMFPPGEYRERLIQLFFERFQSKADPQQMVDLVIPIYDKYLSDEDIRALTQFYATPLGKKVITILPKVLIECTQAGEKWGEQLGRQSMQEVLTEHPDLQKALEEAAKNAQQR
jgi:hypothetical protein